MTIFNIVEKKRDRSSDLNSSDETDTESRSSDEHRRSVIIPSRRPSILAALGQHHYGSFYLRMGAVGKKSKRAYLLRFIVKI